MNRAEVQSHPGYNVVIAKLYESHDALLEIATQLQTMAPQLESFAGARPSADWVRAASGCSEAFRRIMHDHHDVENETILPYVEAWFEFDCSAIDREHKDLDGVIGAMEAALQTVLAADVLTRERTLAFSDAITTLRGRLGMHFETEEATLVEALLELTSDDVVRMFAGAPPQA